MKIYVTKQLLRLKGNCVGSAFWHIHEAKPGPLSHTIPHGSFPTRFVIFFWSVKQENKKIWRFSVFGGRFGQQNFPDKRFDYLFSWAFPFFFLNLMPFQIKKWEKWFQGFLRPRGWFCCSLPVFLVETNRSGRPSERCKLRQRVKEPVDFVLGPPFNFPALAGLVKNVWEYKYALEFLKEFRKIVVLQPTTGMFPVAEKKVISKRSSWPETTKSSCLKQNKEKL